MLKSRSVTIAPPIRAPTSVPMKVITGISELRSRCRVITRCLGRPLATAVRR